MNCQAVARSRIKSDKRYAKSIQEVSATPSDWADIVVTCGVVPMHAALDPILAARWLWLPTPAHCFPNLQQKLEIDRDLVATSGLAWSWRVGIL